MIKTHAAVGIVCALLAATGAWKVQDWRYGTTIQSMRAEYALAQTAAERSAADAERRMTRQISEAQHEAAKRQQAARRDADNLRAERDRLRDETADAAQRGMSAATTDAGRSATAALRVVFDQCTAEYESMARDAQGHADDTLMLQRAWPR